MIPLIFILSLFFIGLGLSWIITCGIIYLITLCFGWTFTWGISTGVWLILLLLSFTFNRMSRTD